jgi:putative transposase
VHFDIRHGDKVDSTIILTALGVDLAGNKEVLALRACAEEDKDGWSCLLQDLRSRGATHIDLIVTDGHDGRLSAVSELFSATPRQRCLLHKQRHVLNAIPRRERGEVQAELVGIWDLPSKQEAVAQLAANTRQIRQTLSRGSEEPGPGGGGDSHLLRFPADDAPVHQDHQCHRESRRVTFVSAPIRSTSCTLETSCLTIVWATIQDIRLHKISV